MKAPTKRRPWIPERKAQAGRTEQTDFYVSTQWRKVRNAFIKNNPLCAECTSKGRVVAAYYVDHITPIRQGGEPLDEHNLQSLCKPCHNRKSGQEAHHNHNK